MYEYTSTYKVNTHIYTHVYSCVYIHVHTYGYMHTQKSVNYTEESVGYIAYEL